MLTFIVYLQEVLSTGHVFINNIKKLCAQNIPSPSFEFRKKNKTKQKQAFGKEEKVCPVTLTSFCLIHGDRCPCSPLVPRSCHYWVMTLTDTCRKDRALCLQNGVTFVQILVRVIFLPGICFHERQVHIFSEAAIVQWLQYLTLQC